MYRNWQEIKKIYVKANPENKIVNLTFTRRNRYRPFDKQNQIHCPPGAILDRKYLPREAADLILKKINKYKISVKGDSAILEEIANRSDTSSQTPARPMTSLAHLTDRQHLPAGSSSSETPTPK